MAVEGTSNFYVSFNKRNSIGLRDRREAYLCDAGLDFLSFVCV